MTPKERVAMQQALEALEMYRPLSLPIKLLSQDKTREEAITALREALTEPTAKEKAESYREGYMDGRRDSKLAEQEEPMTDTELINTNCRYTTPLMAEQAEQGPVAYRVWDRMGGISYRRTKPSESEYVEWDALYAAPLAQQVTPVTQAVRTKDPCNSLQDLTDDEIFKIIDDFSSEYAGILSHKSFARAVIAADREKNK